MGVWQDEGICLIRADNCETYRRFFINNKFLRCLSNSFSNSLYCLTARCDSGRFSPWSAEEFVGTVGHPHVVPTGVKLPASVAFLSLVLRPRRHSNRSKHQGLWYQELEPKDTVESLKEAGVEEVRSSWVGNTSSQLMGTVYSMKGCVVLIVPSWSVDLRSIGNIWTFCCKQQHQHCHCHGKLASGWRQEYEYKACSENYEIIR